MNTEEKRNRILSNLRDLKGIPEYKTINVAERQMIKDWSDKVQQKSLDSKFIWRV